MKRSFTLVEVLVCFLLFSLSLSLLLPPLSRSGKNIREQSAHLLVQSVADEALNSVYTKLFQEEPLTQEKFIKALSSHEEGPYLFRYSIEDIESKGKESPYAGLWVSLEVESKEFTSAKAQRNFYLCVKLNQ